MTFAIEVIDASGPMWADAEQQRLDLVVQFSHLKDVVQFTATPDDACSYGQELFARALAGEFGEIAPYEAPPPENLRWQTLKRLLDRAQLYMGPLQDAADIGSATAEENALLAAWKAYRVSLMRLATSQALLARAIRWPTPPTAPF